MEHKKHQNYRNVFQLVERDSHKILVAGSSPVVATFSKETPVISKRAERFFEFAKKMALLSSYEKFRHGAIVVNHGSIMSAGHNKDRTTTFGARFRPKELGPATIHAELAAILNVPRNQTENADVYVVRLGAVDDLRYSKPCPMCQAAMKFVGIKRVFYSAEDGTFEMMRL